MHKVPENVVGDDVAFLDAVDRGRRHDEAVVDHPGRGAATRFAELPLVEMPIRPSPALAWAMTWRAKTCSNPMSLPMAEIMARSATRLIAASASRPAVIGWTNSTATCEASQLDPPLPMENMRPPRR